MYSAQMFWVAYYTLEP